MKFFWRAAKAQMGTEPNAEMTAYMVTLHGKVQKIGFRAKTAKLAKGAQVTGWVYNHKAGHVQIHVEGTAKAVATFMGQLHVLINEIGGADILVTRASVLHHQKFRVVQAIRNDKGNIVKASVLRAKTLIQEFRSLNVLLLASGHSEPAAARDLALHIPSRFMGDRPQGRKSGPLPYKLSEVCGSFAGEIWADMLARNASAKQGHNPAAILDSKINAPRFVTQFGLRLPEILQSDVPLEDIIMRPGTVIKPVNAADSHGVYCIFSADRIRKVRSRDYLKSFAALRADMQEAIIQPGQLSNNRWIVEELITDERGDIPNDLKFYCCYGHAPLILEVDRKGDSNRYCWWRRDMSRIETGKYDGKLFDSTPFDREYLEIAERISAAIPLPFVRIDLFRSANGPIFGEFTPRPGQTHRFNAEIDCWMGQQFATARGRLMADLFNGRKFPEYEAFLSSIPVRR